MAIPKVLLLLESARTCERDFLRGVARYAHLHGPWAFYQKPKFYLTSADGLTHQQLYDLDPDGIIASDAENLETVLAACKPTLIHTFRANHHSTPMIVGDVAQTGRMAAEHLRGLGFRHFAYCGMGDYYWSRGRCASFTAALYAAGFTPAAFELDTQMVNISLKQELQRLTNWITELPKPVGLMSCADDCSQYLVEACKAAGVEIPSEAAIIGVDDDDMVCELSDPPLTSIALDFAKAGFEAADLLDQLMAGRPPARTAITVLPSRIAVRTSTDILAIEDTDVAAAVRYIRQHANHLIQIEDVLSEIACSRRMLHNKFMRTLGHSIHDEIRTARVERIARMLRETNMPVTAIALKLGYNSFNHISRYFKQATGMNPLAYRKLWS